jgi:hypothetical protein
MLCLVALSCLLFFLSCLHVACSHAVFCKSFKYSIIDHIFNTETLISDAHLCLFKRFKDNTERCLNQLLPELRDLSYLLKTTWS